MRGRVGVRVDRDLVERARRSVPGIEVSVYLEALLLSDLDRRSEDRGFSWRDEANAITAIAFRNGFLEQLHAGTPSALVADPALSRITDAEMRKLMIESGAKVEALLRLRERNPAAYALLMRREHQTYCREWERDDTTSDGTSIETEQLFDRS